LPSNAVIDGSIARTEVPTASTGRVGLTNSLSQTGTDDGDGGVSTLELVSVVTPSPRTGRAPRENPGKKVKKNFFKRGLGEKKVLKGFFKFLG